MSDASPFRFILGTTVKRILFCEDFKRIVKFVAENGNVSSMVKNTFTTHTQKNFRAVDLELTKVRLIPIIRSEAPMGAEIGSKNRELEKSMVNSC